MPEAGGGKEMLMKVFSPFACDVPWRAQAVRAYVFSQLQHPGCYFKSFSLRMELMAFNPRYINLSSLQTRGCWSSCFRSFHPTGVPDVLRVTWCFIVFDVSEFALANAELPEASSLFIVCYNCKWKQSCTSLEQTDSFQACLFFIID